MLIDRRSLLTKSKNRRYIPMNLKKIAITSLAVLTAAVSVASVSANANTLGESRLVNEFEIADGQDATVSVYLDGRVGNPLTVTATIPADTLPAGQYSFRGEIVADADQEADYEDYIMRFQKMNIDYFDLVDLNFYNADGEDVHPTDVTVDFSTAKAAGYDSVWIQTDDPDVKYEKLPHMVYENHMNALVPHFSRFVIAALPSYPEPESIAPRPDDDYTDVGKDVSVVPSSSNVTPQTSTTPSDVTPQPSTTPSNAADGTAKTGDNSAATGIVFAVMAMAALGTAVVAGKAKKSAK